MSMGSKLNALRGLRVEGAVLITGDAGVSFENGIVLVIYNKFELIGFVADDPSILVGKTVVDVDERERMTIITFELDFAIQIDMRDDAYTGPEAMQLRMPGEPIVIWN